MDTYTVATRMVLEDRGMVRGLQNIAKLAKEAEAALKGARTGVNELFSTALIARVNQFSEGLSRAQTGLRSLGRDSGLDRLNQQLREANELSERLARTTARVRGGGGGAIGHRGGGILNHGFLQTAYDVDMIGSFIASAFKPAMQLGHQRALAMIMGENPQQTRAMEAAAFRTARSTPQIDAAEMFKIERELLPVVAAGTPKGEDPLGRMIEHLGDAAKTNALLENYLGDEKSGGSGHRMLQYYNALRSGELLGLGQDPKRLKEWTDMATQAVIASGGRLDMNQIRQFVSTAGSAAIAMDPQFILRNLSELMVEQGGAKVGTMAATFMQSGAGRMTQMAAAENIALCLLDPSKIKFPAHSGGRPVLGDDAWKDESMRFNQQGQWAIHDLAPAIMQKLGVNLGGMTDEEIANRVSAANLSQLEKVGITKELAHLFSDRNAQKFAEQLMLHSTAMTRFAGRMDHVNANAAADIDPMMAWGGLVGAFKTLREAALDAPLNQLIGPMHAASDLMTTIAAAFKDHPVLAGNAMGLGGVGAVGIAGYSAFSFLRAGPALTGAAASLEGAAAALTRSAAVQAGEGGLWKDAGFGWMGKLGLAGLVTAVTIELAKQADDEMRSHIDDAGLRASDLHDKAALINPDGPLGLSPDWLDMSSADTRPGLDGRMVNGKLVPGLIQQSIDNPVWTLGGQYTNGSGLMPGFGPSAFGDTGGDAGSALGTATAEAISTIVNEVKGAVANLVGNVTLSGDVHLNVGSFMDALGHLVAQGVAHAASSGTTGIGTGPDYSGGALLPGPM
jgi:hypothetical protein